MPNEAGRVTGGESVLMTPGPGRSATDLQVLSSCHSSPVTFRHGSIIDPEARPGSSYYVVQSGLAAASVAWKKERPVCVAVIGPGGVIGPEVPSPTAMGQLLQTRALGTVTALRIPLLAFRQSLDSLPDLTEAYLRYLQSRVVQAQQVAACNIRHKLVPRCAHWLLRLHAYMGDVLPITHESVASMLGARRAGVSVTLRRFQEVGAIRQDRGTITILDANRLGAAACPCPIAAIAELPGPALASLRHAVEQDFADNRPTRPRRRAISR